MYAVRTGSFQTKFRFFHIVESSSFIFTNNTFSQEERKNSNLTISSLFLKVIYFKLLNPVFLNSDYIELLHFKHISVFVKILRNKGHHSSLFKMFLSPRFIIFTTISWSDKLCFDAILLIMLTTRCKNIFKFIKI